MCCILTWCSNYRTNTTRSAVATVWRYGIPVEVGVYITVKYDGIAQQSIFQVCFHSSRPNRGRIRLKFNGSTDNLSMFCVLHKQSSVGFALRVHVVLSAPTNDPLETQLS
jgi:hypothetical protein